MGVFLASLLSGIAGALVNGGVGAVKGITGAIKNRRQRKMAEQWAALLRQNPNWRPTEAQVRAFGTASKEQQAAIAKAAAFATRNAPTVAAPAAGQAAAAPVEGQAQATAGTAENPEITDEGMPAKERSGIGKFFLGTPEGEKRFQRFTPQQQRIMNTLGQLGLQGVTQYQSFDPYEKIARRDFEEQTIPGIAERFSRYDAKRSSAYGRQMERARVDFETNLAGLRAQHGLQQQGVAQHLLGLGLEPQFSSVRQHAIPGVFERGGTQIFDVLSQFAPQLIGALGAAGFAALKNKLGGSTQQRESRYTMPEAQYDNRYQTPIELDNPQASGVTPEYGTTQELATRGEKGSFSRLANERQNLEQNYGRARPAEWIPSLGGDRTQQESSNIQVPAPVPTPASIEIPQHLRTQPTNYEALNRDHGKSPILQEMRRSGLLQ